MLSLADDSQGANVREVSERPAYRLTVRKTWLKSMPVESRAVTSSVSDDLRLLAETDADPEPGTPQWDALWEAANNEFGNVSYALRRSGDALARNDGLHNALLEIAVSPFGKQYFEHGVNTNPYQTFGIEIEFQGGNRDAIALDLYQLGIGSSPVTQRYHHGDRVNGWAMETDASVSGGELVSPALTDTPATWRNLATVCEVIKKHGGRVDYRTGGHIHVGIASTGFRDPLAGVKKLIQLYAWSEDLLYRIGAAPESYPFHRGMSNGYEYTKPLGNYYTSLMREIELDGMRRYERRGLAFKHVYRHGELGTIEFRLFDGTLDPEHIQSNVMVACALMNAARRLGSADIPHDLHTVGQNDAWTAAHPEAGERLLRKFADLVMETPAQKLKLYSSYQRSDWPASPTTATQRIQSKREEAVTREIDRVVTAMANADVSLAAADKQWLKQAIDYRVAAQVSEPPSEAAKTAYRWWLAHPLPRLAVNRQKWGATRIAQAADFVINEDREAYVEQCISDAANAGNPLSDVEVTWLRQALTNEAPASLRLAPTREVEDLYSEVMSRTTSQDPAAPFDIRLLSGVVTRWHQYSKLGPYSSLRDSLAEMTRQQLNRALTPEEFDEVARIALYSQNYDATTTTVRSLEFATALAQAVRQTTKAGTLGKSTAALINVVSAARLGEAIDAELQAIAIAHHPDEAPALTEADQTWIRSLLKEGTRGRWEPPSEAAESAMFAWANGALPDEASKNAVWAEVVNGLRSDIAHYRGIADAMNSAIGGVQRQTQWELAPADRSWLFGVSRKGQFGPLPSVDAGKALDAMLAPERSPANVGGQAWKSLRDVWRQRRIPLLQEYHRDAVIAQIENIEPVTAEDRAWIQDMLTTLDSDVESYDPSPAAVQVLAECYGNLETKAVGYDAMTTNLLRDSLSHNWRAWRAREVALERREALVQTITENEKDDVPENLEAWCRRMTVPVETTDDTSLYRPPSPEALVATARWMKVPAAGDADAADAFERTRQETWSASCAAVKEMKLWMHPRWKRALAIANEVAKQGQPPAPPALEATF